MGYGFEKQDAISRKGTKKIIQYYKSKGKHLHSIEDNQSFYKADIDLILKENGQFTKIEVKVDTYTSGNFFLETISNVAKNEEDELEGLGCLLITKADKIYYYFINSKKLYIFNAKSLKNWILSNKLKHPERPVWTHLKNGGKYESRGITPSIFEVIKDLNHEVVEI